MNKILTFILSVTLSFASYAGVDEANTMLDTVVSVLSSLGLGVTVIMVSIAGYRVYFGANAVDEFKKIGIAVALIGGASTIGKLFW